MAGGRPRAPCARELLPWVKQLSYFLNHFPDDHGGIEPLRQLERSLLRRERESREKSRLGKESRAGKESREKEGASAHPESASAPSSTPRRQILPE